MKFSLGTCAVRTLENFAVNHLPKREEENYFSRSRAAFTSLLLVEGPILHVIRFGDVCFNSNSTLHLPCS